MFRFTASTCIFLAVAGCLAMAVVDAIFGERE